MNKNIEQAVFANGCFWCTEAVFLRLEGVLEVVPGFTGGHIKNPAYREITTGRTGHAEGIKISYDSNVIGYETLLEVFFATHDPTTLNRQANDVGTQYRSEIFYISEVQKQQAEAFIKLLSDKKVFQDPIVTAVSKLDVFYDAEDDHKEYYDRNKNQPYCQFIITPKIDKIKKYYADKLKAN